MSASLCQPISVALRGQMLYVAETCNRGTIRQIDLQAKTISSLAGDLFSSGFKDGAAMLANINSVYTMALDKAGNIYFSEHYSHRVRLLNMTSKIVSTVAGLYLTAGFVNGPASVSKFENPGGIALDTNDNLYVSDNATRIRKISYE